MFFMTSGQAKGTIVPTGTPVPLYADAACTLPADVLSINDNVIPGTIPTLYTDSNLEVPLFKFPDVPDPVVYTRVLSGPVVPLHPRADDRFDTITAASGILVSQQAGATDLAKLQTAVTAGAAQGRWVIVDKAFTVSGTVTVPSGSRINSSQGSITQQGNLTATFRLTNVTNVRFRNVNVVGKGSDYVNNSTVYPACGIWLEGTTSDVIVEGGSLLNLAGAGILTSLNGGNSPTNFHVRNVKITGPGTPSITPTTDNYGGCIVLQHDGPADWSVTGCDLSLHAQGIVTGEINRFRVSNNYVHDIVGQHGLYLEPGADFVISDNLIRNTALQGIKLQIPVSTSPDVDGGTLVGNTITNTGSHCIILTQVPGATQRLRRLVVANNVLTSSGIGGDGVNANNLAGVIINDNNIFNVRKGLNISLSSGVTAYDNTIDLCSEQGINLVSVTQTRVSRNTITNPGTANGVSTEFGIEIQGSGSGQITIDDNTVTDTAGNMKYGLYIVSGVGVDQTTCMVRRNVLAGATDYGARLDSTMTIGEWTNNTCSGTLGALFGFPTSLLVKGQPNQSVATAAPTTGTWTRGDIVWNRNPTVNGIIGWACVASGTPGTWSSFGSAGAGSWTGPSTNNMLGASFDPIQANANMTVMTAGVLFLVKVDLPYGGSVSAIDHALGVAGATLTGGQNLAGVYEYAIGGNLLGTSVDQTSAWTSVGQKSAALVTPTTTLNAGSAVYVAFLFNGTTSPQLRGLAVSAGFVNVKIPTLPRFATAGTGLTALPTTLPTLTASVIATWAGVS